MVKVILDVRGSQTLFARHDKRGSEINERAFRGLVPLEELESLDFLEKLEPLVPLASLEQLDFLASLVPLEELIVYCGDDEQGR